MRKLSILSEPQDKLDQPPAVAKRISKIGGSSTRYIQVISETKSLKIETRKCEGSSGDYWRYSLNHHLKLVALTNSGAVF